MKNQPENELLSAYLDGELTAAEQSRVERLLAGDPAAKQLLDELRTLNAAVQSLPREGLGEDLSSRIFQIAEQRKMSGDDSTSNSEPGRPRPRLIRQFAERFKNNPRMIVWPLVVVSVAVLLMIFNPEQRGPIGGGNRNIAQAPKDRNTGEKADIENRARTPNSFRRMRKPTFRIENQPSMRAVPSTEGSPTSSQYAAKDIPGVGANHLPPAVNPPSNLFVVDCEVSREALELADFRKMLSANDIAWTDEAAGDAILMTPAELAEAAEIVRKIDSGKSEGPDANANMEMIFVEATPGQIGAMLNGLKTMPEKFVRVSIKAPSRHRPTPAELGAPSSTSESEKGSAVKLPQPVAPSNAEKNSTIEKTNIAPPSTDITSIEKTISRAQRVPRSSLVAPPDTSTPSTALPASRMQRILFVLHVVEK